MSTRQAKRLSLLLLAFTIIVTACSPQNQPVPTSTLPPATATSLPRATATIELFPTYTPLACLARPGRVEEGALDSFNPPQEFRVYLPPCYDERPGERYPVLYLLHGQTYTDDQWIRLGAARVLDDLIHSGEAAPFIIVFPDDRYWNLQAGSGFGGRLIDDIIPYIDSNYRTIPSRNHRAIGGLSRGAGWSLRLGLTEWRLFGTIGLHSLAVLQKDASKIWDWIAGIPPSSRPRVFMDIGDNDPELSRAQQVESLFNDFSIPYEWHLYSGDHTEGYWEAHMEEYIRWYAEQWDDSE